MTHAAWGRVRRGPSSILVAGAGDHTGKCRRERWQILIDDEPDCREVDPEIAMHDHVAKAGQLTPRHLRLGSPDVFGQALARFGERLQVADTASWTRRDASKCD